MKNMTMNILRKTDVQQQIDLEKLNGPYIIIETKFSLLIKTIDNIPPSIAGWHPLVTETTVTNDTNNKCIQHISQQAKKINDPFRKTVG